MERKRTEVAVGARSYPMTAPSGPTRPRRRAPAGRARSGLALGCATALLAGCVSTPVTGRSAFLPFPVSQDKEIGEQAYQEVLAESEPVTSGPQAEMVQRVMRRLVAVADDPGFDWEVTLLAEPETANAFCLPGGKMAVYTGILPITQDEAGLAVVMGHEIAHAVARHGMQRISQQVGVELFLAMIDAGDYAPLVQTAVSLVQLRYSRADESEADHIGLVYMARAGYDPREAVAFWGRMSSMTGGGPPEFLSTHPSHETRIARLEELMPEALAEYRKATGQAAP